MKKIKTIFFLGILLRLLIIPFFAYPEDIFETHNTSFLILDDFKNFLSVRFSPLSHLIDSFFLFIFSPIWPEGLREALQNQNYFYIPKIHRTLFFFKLPFLLFEIFAYYLFYRFLRSQEVDHEKIKKIFIFLLFNPIVLYSVYIFGRFESYGFLFSFLILIFLYKREFSLFSILVFSLAPFVREFFLIVIVWLILFSEYKLWQKAVLFIFSYLPYSLFLFLTGNLSKAVGSYVKGGLGAYMMEPKFYYHEEKYIYLYFFVLAFLLVFLYLRSGRKINFAKAAFISLFVYYALAYFHHQYFVWSLPFLVFVLAFERENFSRLLYVSWLIGFLYLSFPFPGAVTTFGIAFPLANAFRFISLDKVFPDIFLYFDILRSLFKGVVLSLAVYFSLK